MRYMKHLTRIAVPAGLGIFLLAAGGCGNNSVSLDPEGGEKIKQARINALGPAGASNVRGPGPGSTTPPVVNSQAAARQRAQSGR